MRHIILTGQSGIGKTTIANKLQHLWTPCSTGSLFQSMFALGSELTVPVDKVTSAEAFFHFVNYDLKRGMERYEELKANGQNHAITKYIETLRYCCPDLPSRWVGKFIEHTVGPVITEAISEQELQHLMALPSRFVVAILECSNPVKRASVYDNRYGIGKLFDSDHDGLKNFEDIRFETGLVIGRPAIKVLYDRPQQSGTVAKLLEDLIA
jgi:energy-coupling factor transporter ATP-binding protein EcfA2